jgi:exopolyphosphatase / guanosine-5'-triphosphate,3'-diphosphate pyrophosphatase
MRAAVIDIGSNSIKLIIGESVGEEVKILEILKNIIGIGYDTFYKGQISQEIFNKTINVLSNYKTIINEYAVETTKVIATTAVREAANKDIFVDTILRKTGFEVEVLNVGDVVYYIDAFLSYKLKTKYPIHEKNLIIAELGAGSLDISVMEKGFSLMNIGIPLGTLRIKQFKSRLDGSHRETGQALDEYIENEMQYLLRSYPNIKIDDVILIDESYSKTLQKIQPNKTRPANFFPLTFREAKQFLKTINGNAIDELTDKYDIPPDISETLDGYAYIVYKLFRLVKQRSIYILETSLSEALLANLLFAVAGSKKYNKTNQLISVAKFLCQRFGSDYKHIKQVAVHAEQLFHDLKNHFGLGEQDLLYLLMAVHLHNIGQFICNRGYHKHSEYIISALNLFRLTPQEIKIIAAIARYHRKAIPQQNHFFYGSLTTDQQIVVQKLSSILRIADALDSSHKQKVKKMEVTFNPRDEIDLTVYVQDSFTYEKVVLGDMKKYFEGVSGLKLNLIVNRLK